MKDEQSIRETLKETKEFIADYGVKLEDVEKIKTLKPYVKQDGDTLENVYYLSTKNNIIQKVFLKDVIDINKQIWSSMGRRPVTVISLAGCQSLADYENLVEKKMETVILPTTDNHQQHVVNIWVGYAGDNNSDNWTRASGEASTLNTGEILQDASGNKRVSERTKIDSQYKYSMADKRAYCRAVLKHLRLFGVYSAVEADSFNKDKDSFDF